MPLKKLLKKIKEKTMIRTRCIKLCKVFKESVFSYFFRPAIVFGEWIKAYYYYITNPSKNIFYIITSLYNVGEDVIQSLNSVYNQNYNRELIHHIVINDASTDNTHQIIQQWMANHHGHSVEYYKNNNNIGGSANNIRGFRMAKPFSIVIELNGDDWLPDSNVLKFLNMIYCNNNIWMTNNTVFFSTGKRVDWSKPVPRRIIENNKLREHTWNFSALHSFRSELFTHVNDNSLVDPKTGKYWDSAWDQSHYLPMFEMAGTHNIHIERTMYVYNRSDKSEGIKRKDHQTDCMHRIRQLPKYNPIEKLVWNNNLAYNRSDYGQD
ncbi:MAG: glycosyltransferase family 2 protein [Candidatus Auribacterota bacterium]|jgi:glycosyltransferase involved in cell wall biosynthesis|nr:glycosyltransferase family 2 protein [Candidatus Auribacterota bacterium]